MKHGWLVGFLIGCGGGSGGLDVEVDGDKRLVTLSIAEYRELCEYASAAFPPRTITCPEGDKQVGHDFAVEECVAQFTGIEETIPDCPATVEDYVACTDALGALTDPEFCGSGGFEDIPVECHWQFETACGFD